MNRLIPLKCWPEPFELTRVGAKPFEVRDDMRTRRYEAGDVLRLMEWEPGSMRYTGRALDVQVTYLLRMHETPEPWNLRHAGPVAIMAIRLLAPVGQTFDHVDGRPVEPLFARGVRDPR